MQKHRIEKDSLGEVRVPEDAYYGAQTKRAVENFPISGLRFPRAFIRALGMIKRAAAEVNAELGLLEADVGRSIAQASQEVAEGMFDDHFVVDVFQTGSGTSTNMNANEVIANRAIELEGGRIGSKQIHPNDHVNLGQSSNDVIPTSLHVAALEEMEGKLLPALSHLQSALESKSREFDDIVKIGRTHLQDAVPIRLGQEFSGYVSMIEHSIRRIEGLRPHLSELAIGGTAVGTGLNCHPEFPRKVVQRLCDWTHLAFREAENRFEALAARDAAVEASGALKTVAGSVAKIANDLRWLASGPRCGIGEINLPALQPGSSIMPGKVNPVIPEAVLMVAAQVTGNDVTISIAGQSGSFELNVMKPVIIYNLLQSVQILAAAADLMSEKCVAGTTVNHAHIQEMTERSLAMVTALVPEIGYERAAKIAQKSHRTGRTVREVCRQMELFSEEELDRALDLRKMTGKMP
jgi:fumarate hydratase class II